MKITSNQKNGVKIALTHTEARQFRSSAVARENVAFVLGSLILEESPSKLDSELADLVGRIENQDSADTERAMFSGLLSSAWERLSNEHKREVLEENPFKKVTY